LMLTSFLYSLLTEMEVPALANIKFTARMTKAKNDLIAKYECSDQEN